MTLVLVVLLALLWGAVIVPSLLRSRRTPHSTTDTFRRHLAALEHNTIGRGPARPSKAAARRSMAVNAGRWVLSAPPPRRRGGYRPRPALSSGRGPRAGEDPVIRRRKTVFVALLAMAAGTFVLSFVPGLGALLKANLALDAILLVDVMYLVATRPPAKLPADIAGYGAPFGSRRVSLRDEQEEWAQAEGL
ncbi:MAG TPA: hypothetical protein VFW71_10300 [Actinomycetota bacterium]|nr:hypothetical protein [Actinomycetota bacterium]